MISLFNNSIQSPKLLKTVIKITYRLWSWVILGVDTKYSILLIFLLLFNANLYHIYKFFLCLLTEESENQNFIFLHYSIDFPQSCFHICHWYQSIAWYLLTLSSLSAALFVVVATLVVVVVGDDDNDNDDNPDDCI